MRSALSLVDILGEAKVLPAECQGECVITRRTSAFSWLCSDPGAVGLRRCTVSLHFSIKMTISLNKPKLDNFANEIWMSAERLRGEFKP